MKTALFSVFVVSALAACGDLPQPSVPNGNGDTDSTDVDTLSAIPDPPTVSLATTTTSSTVAVSGTTEAASGQKSTNIIITGGAASSTATPADSSGSFCVTVPLNEGTNVLSIVAQRQDGTTSNPTKKTIKYVPSTTTTATVRSASTTDAAVYKTPGSNLVGDNMKLMTDDDDTTYTTFSDYPSIYIDLGAAYEVSDIELVFPGTTDSSDGSYAEGYDLYSTTDASPTRPVDSTTAGWSNIASVNGAAGGNGDGGSDTFSFGTPITTRWIALNVTDNNIWYSWTVKIASIHVYGTKVSSGSTGGGSGDDNVIASCQ